MDFVIDIFRKENSIFIILAFFTKERSSVSVRLLVPGQNADCHKDLGVH